MFSYIKDDDKGSKTAKVIMKNVIKKYVKKKKTIKNIFFNNKQVYQNENYPKQQSSTWELRA